MNFADIAFDADLMRRYEGEGPRYTSYPTAAHFEAQIGEAEYRKEISRRAADRPAAPLSLYAHIPFCYAPCFYCACNKVVTSRMDLVESYVQSLYREIELRAACFEGRRSVEQLHLGGGTPTFLPTRRLIGLIDRIDRHFPLSSADSRDFSIEIDPRAAGTSLLRLLASLGFNRLSLGVQDFDETVQRAVNRVQPAEIVEHVYAAAREIGFRSINFDLIYGLPHQTASGFAATLERVVAMRPDRVAVYGYAHLPQRFKAQRRIRAQDLPNAAQRLGLLECAIDTLGAAGYLYIGMDHFALPEDSLCQALEAGSLQRSFQGYTTHADLDLVNIGVSAIGRVGDLFVQNAKELNSYASGMKGEHLPTQRGIRLSQDDRVRSRVIQGIMCHGRVDEAAVEQEFGIDFERYFGAERERLAALAADDLVDLRSKSLILTPKGRLLMRNVAMTFDAYVSRGAAPRVGSRLI